jgi:hypothetical protein
LKAALGVDEVSDVEAAASEGADDQTYFRWLIEHQTWRRLIRTGAVGRALTICETEAGERFALADALGMELLPLADHESTEYVCDP